MFGALRRFSRRASGGQRNPNAKDGGLERLNSKQISAEEFDRIFDEGEEDILQYADLSKTEVLYPKPKRISVDMSPWMIKGLDKVANQRAVSRQAVIKMALAEYLNEQGIRA